MTLGTWTRTGANFGFPPATHFRLDTGLASGPGMQAGARKVSPRLDDGRPIRFASWRRIAGDSLLITWSNGFSMGSYRLVARGDSVFGRALTASDARTEFPDPTAPAQGMRVPCSRAGDTPS